MPISLKRLNELRSSHTAGFDNERETDDDRKYARLLQIIYADMQFRRDHGIPEPTVYGELLGGKNVLALVEPCDSTSKKWDTIFQVANHQ